MNFKQVVIPFAVILLLTTAANTYFYRRRDENAAVPFYNRLRKKRLASNKEEYFIVSRIVIDQETGAVSASLINKQTKRVYSLDLKFLDGSNSIRLVVNDPVKPRHTVSDVIVKQDEKLITPIISTTDNNRTTIKHKNYSIIIHSDRFQIDIYSTNDDSLIAAINPNNFLRIEGNEPLSGAGIMLDCRFPQAERTYGLPLRAERLSLRSTIKGDPYRLYNVDNYAYSAGGSKDANKSLYGSVPVLYAHGSVQSVGLFWLNTAETYVDIAADHHTSIDAVFMSESGALDLFVMLGPGLSDCVKQYATLTGVAPLPQLFALGYHQSRYSYMSASEIKDVSDQFDANNLPLDAIWMDIDCTEDKKYFTWHPTNYPNPDGLLKFLASKGRKGVVINDPHIKVDPDYTVYSDCHSRGYFVAGESGDYQAECWPGLSSWIDFFNPDARRYYSEKMKEFTENSENLHIWNDMNEPAVFGVKCADNSMPKRLKHHDGWLHRDIHNQYGFYQTMATYEGLLSAKRVRPFVLTRAHFAGTQRYAAVWTGDNAAEWAHLKISVPMCLAESLSGISLCGADVGGFAHAATDEELLQRWYQAAAWLPFFRGHSAVDSPRREPYLYNEEILDRIRMAIEQRYKHLPYWYTLFWHHFTNYEPVIRPLVYHYPNDKMVFDMDDQFLVGRDILIHPIMDAGVREIDVYLPEYDAGNNDEIWYSLDKGRVFASSGNPRLTLSVDMDTVPVFYRGGSIVPVKECVDKSSEFMHNEPITLYVFLNIEGIATGTLYVDDAKSFDYLKGRYTYVSFSYKNNTISNCLVNRGTFYNKPTMLGTVVLYGLGSKVHHAYVKGDEMMNSDIRVIRDPSRKCVRIVNLNIDVRNYFLININ